MQQTITYLKQAILCVTLLLPVISFGQEGIVINSGDINSEFIPARVVEIVQTTYPLVMGVETEFQELHVRIIGQEDEIVTAFNDYTPVERGDTVYIGTGYNPDTGEEGYYIREVNRIWSLVLVFMIFVVTYTLIAGAKALRSLLALAVAVGCVWYVLLPAIIAGFNPLVVGVGISVVILGLAIFITHGFTIVSLSSYLGSVLAIVATSVLALYASSIARISGLVGDESSTILILYGDTINIQYLLLATMIIGILGVLDDVAVMQAALVREFMYENKYSMRELFTKAMRVGQEHAAALVNTLVLAYVAVALPLFTIILAPRFLSDSGGILPLSVELSNELFAIEFIRSVVGSFGLVITIPLVTVIAILLFHRYPPTEPGHGHHHHH